MKNNIRKLVAKIESQSNDSKISAIITMEVEKQGISKIRFYQFRGNHRQPNLEEVHAIHKVLRKHDPNIQMEDLYSIPEKAEL